MIENAPLKRLTHGRLTIEGYSRAAVQTYWRIPESSRIADSDILLRRGLLKPHEAEQAQAATSEGLNIVDKQVTIHSLTAPADCDEPTVSFHVYSLPFDSCVIFDTARGRCERKELAFDSAPDGYTVRVR